MTEKRFEFKRFYVDIANINEIALYEIDNNPHDDLDDNNLFYVYSTTDANVQSIVDKLNSQEELIKRLKTIREEQTETILEHKRKIRELEEENKRLQIDIMGQSEEIEILSDENKRLKQGKYIYGIHGGSND